MINILAILVIITYIFLKFIKKKKVKKMPFLILLIIALILDVAIYINMISKNNTDNIIKCAILWNEAQDKIEEGAEKGLIDFGFTPDENNQEQQNFIDEVGGIYPKDKKLQNRAKILEIVEKSAQLSSNDFVTIKPQYLIGVIYRESSNRIYDIADDDSNNDVLRDLLISRHVCMKTECSWETHGHSHYINGKIVDGVDNFDPYNDLINTDKKLYTEMGKYDTSSGNPDHAIGFVQYEIPYVYSYMKYFYPIGQYESIKQNEKDTELGFIRPNVLYAPDAIYCCSMAHARKTGYEQFNGEAFKSLSSENQNFIKFCASAAAYGYGGERESTSSMINELIKVAESGKIENLDEMLKNSGMDFFDESKCAPQGNWRKVEEYLTNTYGLNIEYGTKNWIGIYAACVGNECYPQMKNKILENTEKNKEDNILGDNIYEGSGSSYYVAELGIRWYFQTLKETSNSKSSWGNMPLNEDGCTMKTGGCGIYTIAMLASNLYNKDITPDIVRNSLPNYDDKGYALVKSCLLDRGVKYLLDKLELTYRIENFNNSSFKNTLYSELDKGNLILCVVEGTSDWYNGDGHYIAIRGYNSETKKLRCITSSWGWDSKKGTYRDPIETMKIEMEYDKWINILSDNRKYVWIVGK